MMPFLFVFNHAHREKQLDMPCHCQRSQIFSPFFSKSFDSLVAVWMLRDFIQIPFFSPLFLGGIPNRITNPSFKNPLICDNT